MGTGGRKLVEGEENTVQSQRVSQLLGLQAQACL
jgi:hypothetical protein